MYDIIENVDVCGIPCKIKVLYYKPFKEHKIIHGRIIPPEIEEFDYHLLDRKGYRARWLENKLTENDEDHIHDLISEYYSE